MELTLTSEELLEAAEVISKYTKWLELTLNRDATGYGQKSIIHLSEAESILRYCANRLGWFKNTEIEELNEK